MLAFPVCSWVSSSPIQLYFGSFELYSIFQFKLLLFDSFALRSNPHSLEWESDWRSLWSWCSLVQEPHSRCRRLGQWAMESNCCEVSMSLIQKNAYNCTCHGERTQSIVAVVVYSWRGSCLETSCSLVSAVTKLSVSHVFVYLTNSYYIPAVCTSRHWGSSNAQNKNLELKSSEGDKAIANKWNVIFWCDRSNMWYILLWFWIGFKVSALCWTFMGFTVLSYTLQLTWLVNNN